MKWIRSFGLFNLFLILGVCLGTQVGDSSLASPNSNHTGSPESIQAYSEDTLEHSALQPGQTTSATSPSNGTAQTNYLVILVNHLKVNSENDPIKPKSLWLVISQPGVSQITWAPMMTFNKPIPVSSEAELNTFLYQVSQDQGVVWDHYLIIDQSGLRLSAYLLNQVINHLAVQSDANTLVQLSERLTSQNIDPRQQAIWISQMCEIVPSSLTHVDVNRFLNLLHRNYLTDLSRSQLQAALYELKMFRTLSLSCNFPTLLERTAAP